MQTMYTTLASYLGPLFPAGLTAHVAWWGSRCRSVGPDDRGHLRLAVSMCLHLLQLIVSRHLSAIDRKAPSWKRPMVMAQDYCRASTGGSSIAAGTAVPDRPSPKA
ncbi:hypothetical protein ACOJBO_08175 [Rhizobium beringeri]